MSSMVVVVVVGRPLIGFMVVVVVVVVVDGNHGSQRLCRSLIGFFGDALTRILFLIAC